MQEETNYVAAVRRVKSASFAGSAFMFSIAVLAIAPVLATSDLVHSYLPWLLLRCWMVGFALYGYHLAGRAGGFRKAWKFPFAVIAFTFLFVWGPPVEVWAAIDWGAAAVIAASAVFLRTEPLK